MAVLKGNGVGVSTRLNPSQRQGLVSSALAFRESEAVAAVSIGADVNFVKGHSLVL
jgi:hypothetical protein